jgi:antibiotic biosynthesis monooxygenase (ABM) superfamily enzyme
MRHRSPHPRPGAARERAVEQSARAGAERLAASPWLARLASTLAAWLAAYLLVLALLSALGDQLGSLPLAVRALVIAACWSPS